MSEFRSGETSISDFKGTPGISFMPSLDPDGFVLTYREVLDALPIASFIADSDRSVSYVSRQWCALTGHTVECALERGYLSIIHPDHVSTALVAWSAATASGTPYRNEFPLRFGDGAYRWVLSEATPMRSREAGDVVGWFGTITDIDDRRRADEALRDSDARQRAFSAALPGVTWSATPTGALEYVGERFHELRGVSPETAYGDGWLQRVHADDRAATETRWRASVATGEPYEGSFRVRMADGTYRWQLVRARPQRKASGEIARWVGVNIDIEEQRRADDAREMFVALAENSGDFIATADRDGNVVYVNEAGRRLLELDGPADAASRRLLDFVAPEDRATIAADALPVVAGAGRWLGDTRFRTFTTGATVPVVCNLFALTDRSGEPLGIATISHDRRGRERVEGGLRLLSRTSAAALHSLDYAATLHNIATAFIEDFASYCIIDSLDAERRWDRTAVHRDPALQPILAALSQPSPEHPIALAINAGTSSVVTVDERWASGFGNTSDRIAAVRELRVRSFVTVPVTTPAGDVIGALTCALDDRVLRENYCNDDLVFVQEVGRRAGAAFANARLYERERRIAVELQSASLPAALPRLHDLALDAEYRPGSAEATIGGDWYDAFELEDGRVAMTVGDVLGHGLHAAVTMTKLRQAMQSAAMLSPDPGAMLAVADKTLRLIDPEGYATAVAAIYDRAERTFAYASAGHPGPALRRPDGTVVDLTRSGMMLGLRAGAACETTLVAAPPGTVIVFYTDGLVEATRDIVEGQRRLSQAVADRTVVDGAGPARAIVEAVLAGGDASDDIAVLVATIGP
ncbi:MAG: hypothetical protein NVS3B16_21500 [Vulcanimicrobiaceae bacterium]